MTNLLAEWLNLMTFRVSLAIHSINKCSVITQYNIFIAAVTKSHTKTRLLTLTFQKLLSLYQRPVLIYFLINFYPLKAQPRYLQMSYILRILYESCFLIFNLTLPQMTIFPSYSIFLYERITDRHIKKEPYYNQ